MSDTNGTLEVDQERSVSFSDEGKSKVATALHAASKAYRAVAKSARNNYDGYDYATLDDYDHACREALAENGLVITTSVVSHEQGETRQSSKGKNEYVVTVVLELRAVHTSGEYIAVRTVGQGQDRGDKGVYKAITGARKYGVAMLLGLVTSDDPERTAPDKSNAPAQRAVPEASTPRGEFAGKLRKWTKIKTDDRNAFGQAAEQAMKAAGVRAKKDNWTDEHFSKGAEWVQGQIDSGVEWPRKEQ